VKAVSATLCAAALLATACLAGAPGCANQTRPARGSKATVFACVAPHGYFARRIAGDLVDVQVLVGAGVNPHTFAPAAKEMVALSGSDLYFRAGLPFEDALCRKLADMGHGLRIIDTRAGIDLLDEADHQRGQHHAAHEKDPHVWMSPKLAARQAATIRDAMSEKYPQHAEAFRRNAAALSAELDALTRKSQRPSHRSRAGRSSSSTRPSATSQRLTACGRKPLRPVARALR